MRIIDFEAAKLIDRKLLGYAAAGIVVMCASFLGTAHFLDRRVGGAHRLEVGGFSLGGSGTKLLGKGWSRIESWGTWSDGAIADLVWPLQGRPNSDVRFWIDARIYPHFSTPAQLISVLVNGTKVATLERNFEGGLYGGSFWVASNVATAQSPMHVEFLISNPTQPASIQDGSDQRKLGLGLKSMELSYQGD